MSSDSQIPLLPLPDEVREALTSLRNETPPDEHEFVARLHRRLVAAGQPPTPGRLERAAAAVSDLWRGAAQKRSLLTGALLGALATAAAFLLLSGGHPLRDGAAVAAPDDEATDVDGSPAEPLERKTQRAVGDRHLTRDRLEQDIGAERPERSPHLAPPHPGR